MHDWGYEFVHETKDTIPGRPVVASYSGITHTQRGKLQVYEACARNFRLGRRTRLLRPWEHLPNLLEEEEHIDVYIANTASEWIRGYVDDRPFDLQVCLMGPHPPFDAPTPDIGTCSTQQHMPSPIMEPPAGPRLAPLQEDVHAKGTQGHDRVPEPNARPATTTPRSHSSTDAIGIVLEALREQGLVDDTWIVYTSVHGEMHGDRRFCQKSVFYEGALNVPLIVRPPGGSEPSTARGLADHFDIANTLLDAAQCLPRLESDHGVSVLRES